VRAQRFTTTLVGHGRGRAFVAVPFDPDQVWSPKPRHHVTGTVNGTRVRAVLETHGGQRGFTLGPAWLGDCHALAVGDSITVEIAPEGPQREDLAEDVAAALDASPEAGAFFDSLAQFYRKAYLRWIDATKRRPEQRAQRIAEMIQLLDAEIKERPKS
jgi:Bacteriocin-protection, YdeI or OmpD-Associated/Domain of unknown function (DUF1905)